MKKTNKRLLLIVLWAAFGASPLGAQTGRPPVEGVPGSAINQNRKNPGPPPTNGVHPIFRSIDGSNNNFGKSRESWGAAVIPRELQPDGGFVVIGVWHQNGRFVAAVCGAAHQTNYKT